MNVVHQTGAIKEIRRLLNQIDESINLATFDTADILHAIAPLAVLAEKFDIDPEFTSDQTDAASTLADAI